MTSIFAAVVILEEDLVVAHHAELAARALLDRLAALLEIAHLGGEARVARLELAVPGFLLRKGFVDLPSCTRMAQELIERFNTMLAGVAILPQYRHVHYIDLRNSLSTGRDYKDWWANELHPTPRGWSRIAGRFAAVLQTLP